MKFLASCRRILFLFENCRNLVTLRASCVHSRGNRVSKDSLFGLRNPGPASEMDATVADAFRKCHNIKSRVNPDIQCPLSATHGDYCSRHYKNPRPYHGKTKVVLRTYTRAEHASIKKIQAIWRKYAPLRRYRLQGPATNAIDLATNQTELYSLDSIAAIPKPYFISFADARKCIWAFDIRTLVHSMATGFPSHNPYTRDTLLDTAKARIHRRIQWLRSRKYQILHVNTEVLTPEQAWNQNVLDIFLKIEALGYYVSCDWYHAMSAAEHTVFYARLFQLWNWRLGLTPQEKERIVPGHFAGGRRLFRFPPEDTIDKSRGWWEKTSLALIEAFITRAHDKEQHKMGALYVLMALVQASRPAALALPWIVETVA